MKPIVKCAWCNEVMVGASLPSGYVPPLHRCLECGGMNNILASGIAQLVPSAHAPLYELIRGSDR